MSPRRNFLLTLAYDGSGFLGWQRLPGAGRSVQGELEAALARLLGEAVEVTGAGRTDRGVDAEGQAASFHSRTALSPGELASGLARELPPDLRCLRAREVDPRFHARFRVRSKLYRYRLLTGPGPRGTDRLPSGERGFRAGGRLDLDAMREAGRALEGERDFASLSNAREASGSTRRLDSVRVAEGEGRVDLLFEGPGFLYNQARIMAGLLLEVGLGKRRASSVAALLEARDRSLAPGALPAEGLCLVEVRYSLPPD